jgi:hypothetical protein
MPHNNLKKKENNNNNNNNNNTSTPNFMASILSLMLGTNGGVWSSSKAAFTLQKMSNKDFM